MQFNYLTAQVRVQEAYGDGEAGKGQNPRQFKSGSRQKIQNLRSKKIKKRSRREENKYKVRMRTNWH